MTIQTLDAALAGMQFTQYFAKQGTPGFVVGRPQSLWYIDGAGGGKGAAPAATAGGTVLSSTGGLVAGQIPHYDPPAGNAYLAQFTGVSSQNGVMLLCDRLMQVGGNSAGAAIPVTLATATTINSSPLPPRDRTGSTNGDGINWALEVVTLTGAGAATPTINYTDQAGTTGQTANLVDTYVAASAVGAFYRFAVASGDTGIRSVQSLTLGLSMTSGAIALVAYRVIAALPCSNWNQSVSVDALTSGFPRLYNGTVPFIVWVPAITTSALIAGTYTETQG